MKLFKFSALLLTIALFSRCSGDENVSPTENATLNVQGTAKIPGGIYTDATFIDYIRASYADCELPKDITKIKLYTADNVLSTAELVDYHSALGYSSYQDLEDFIVLQTSREKYLEQTYKLSSLTLAEQQEIFDTGFSMNIPSYSGKSPCHWRVHAEAVLMHIACGTADVTVVLGLICHGAVTIWHSASLSEC